MKIIDVQHSFFRPVWRRITVVAVCFVWALFEFLAAEFFWGLLAAGIGIYCLREFFLVFDPPGEEE